MGNRTRRLCVTGLIAAVVLSAACQSFTASETPEPDYSADADTNLKRGDEALAGKNFTEAERYFEYVKTKYPYLEASKAAELRLADTDFERDQFAQARDRYQAFVKLHPTHPRVDYAAYRAALTHYREMPSDFFVLPPAEEKDQQEVRSTLAAMNDFLRQHPRSAFADEAKTKLAEARRRLAAHEWYVAEFYRRRARWVAVVGRLRNIVERYEGAGYDERAYLGLHEAYVQLKDEARAKETLRAMAQKLKGTPAGARATALLGESG